VFDNEETKDEKKKKETEADTTAKNVHLVKHVCGGLEYLRDDNTTHTHTHAVIIIDVCEAGNVLTHTFAPPLSLVSSPQLLLAKLDRGGCVLINILDPTSTHKHTHACIEQLRVGGVGGGQLAGVIIAHDEETSSNFLCVCVRQEDRALLQTLVDSVCTHTPKNKQQQAHVLYEF